MTQSNKFCTGCGASITPGDGFCGSCGKKLIVNTTPPAYTPPVYTPPPAYAAPPAYVPSPPPTETLVGMIPSVSRKKGLMAVEGFSVMVTQRRMIFAAATNELINAEAKKAAKEGGFFGGLLNAAAVGLNFYKRYLNMTPDAALAESPQNFAIELARIRKVSIEAGKEIKNYANMKANQGSIIQQHQYENGKLEIETVAERYSFDLPGSSYDMAVETLRKAGLVR